MAKKKAPVGGSAPVLGATNSKYAAVRRVTLTTLKLEIEVPAYVTILAAMEEKERSEKQRSRDDDGDGAKTITVAQVSNVETGEVHHLVVPAVVKSELEASYPDGAYVQKSFMLVKHEKKAGKRYYNYTITEIDPTKEA